jgi:heavy metal-(Cd/Co/Hg/Pb/Zn)-translocating P-type ATPase
MHACTHCHESVENAIYDKAEDPSLSIPFCCQGCLTVYQILHQKGFGEYYQIKESAGVLRRRAPVAGLVERYQFLDDQVFLAEYTEIDQDGLRVVEIYLEGVHCLACLWLIERLPLMHPQLFSSKLDIERSVVLLKMSPQNKLSEVATLLNNLGYKPHVIKSSEDQRRLKNKEERKELLRIGIAAAGASNIMIYAVSIYAGASDVYAQVFNTLTVLFAIPVMTYSAWGFYQNAWNSLKNRLISIDVPIALALIMGFIMGCYNLLTGVTENYFDSLTALVFLLLLSRYFLKKIQERSLRVQDLDFFHHHESVLRSTDSSLEHFQEVHAKYLKPQDIIKLKPQQFIPADGIILQGRTHTNNSLLTGESRLVSADHGDEVFSGTQNLSSEIVVKVLKVGSETRLGEILQSVAGGWTQKSQILQVTQTISQYFILTVLSLSLLLFVVNLQDLSLAQSLERALTLLIVTCPCALALAIPLTFTRSLGLASQNGIFIKSDAAIEKLLQVKNIFIDKTGTLTFGKIQITEMKIVKEPLLPLSDIVFNLERHSQHPIALALLDYVSTAHSQERQTQDLQEIVGQGVKALVEGIRYEIKNYQIFENDQLVATFTVKDLLRPEVPSLIQRLKKRYSIHLLSGDRSEIVESVAQQAGIASTFSQQSPESKSSIVSQTPQALMIGDGANDAIALSRAHVGIAVQGSMVLSLKAADIYVVTPGLSPIENLIVLSQETMHIIYRNIVLSLAYNTLSVLAVFSGHITPLVAAVIMPVSSLTVLLSTLVGTKKMRRLWK